MGTVHNVVDIAMSLWLTWRCEISERTLCARGRRAPIMQGAPVLSKIPGGLMQLALFVGMCVAPTSDLAMHTHDWSVRWAQARRPRTSAARVSVAALMSAILAS
jgi:hypothetical protein